MMGAVKSERVDGYELARKVAEQNRLKLQNYQRQQMMSALASAASSGSYTNSSLQLPQSGQTTIHNYFTSPTVSGGMSLKRPHQDENRIDELSRKGSFGWCETDNNYVAYIFRNNDKGKLEKYASVRMVERKYLNKFLSVLPIEVNSCHCIRSYYITDNECKLLNEINLRHADCIYGKESFTAKDLVVRLNDAKEFYRFLDLCYKKLVLKKSNASDRCGFFRINRESVVPYTVTGDIKYVPLFYFEGETDHLNLKSGEVNGWDLAYLKFCCKVQGIRNELFAADFCKVVALDDIKGHFPQGTTFEDYWPAKGSIEPVHEQKPCAGIWTQKPPPPPLLPGGISPLNMKQSTAVSKTVAAKPTSNALIPAQYNMRHNSIPGQLPYSQQALVASQQYQQLMQQQQRMSSSAAAAAAHHMLPHSASNAAAHQQHQMLRHYDQAAAVAAATAAVAMVPNRGKAFPWKLTQIKDFPIERSEQAPYKMQKALIEHKIVPCINVRPYLFQDLMMTLPDFVKHFFPTLSVDKSRNMLQDVLNVVIYKGNFGHQEILRLEGKCDVYDPAPLVLVRDIMAYMEQMKYMFASIVASNEASVAAVAAQIVSNKRMKIA